MGVGAAIALPSGAALALAITTVLSEAIVGVAIATSILPPVVAAGINLILAAHAAPHAADGLAHAKLVDALLGIAMLVINVGCIFFGCAGVLRLKQVGASGLMQLARAPPPLPRARTLTLEPHDHSCDHTTISSELQRGLLSSASDATVARPGGVAEQSAQRGQGTGGTGSAEPESG